MCCCHGLALINTMRTPACTCMMHAWCENVPSVLYILSRKGASGSQHFRSMATASYCLCVHPPASYVSPDDAYLLVYMQRSGPDCPCSLSLSGTARLWRRQGPRCCLYVRRCHASRHHFSSLCRGLFHDLCRKP